MMKVGLKIKQAFAVTFGLKTLINRAYFFVTIPFLTSLLLLLVSNLQLGLILVLLGWLAIVALNFFYQLYLWSITFFYAQQIGAHDWGEYELNLQELLTDMGVKVRLLIIRVVWYLPFVLLLGGIFMRDIANGALASITSLPGESSTTVIIFLVIVIILQLILENVFINLSLYIYAETGSLLRSFNLIKVVKLLVKSLTNYGVIVFLAFLPNIIWTVAIIPILLISSIPVLGGLFFGFITGLSTMYYSLFIANLQGQIWAQLKKGTNE